jgi:hypothetical protein
VVVEGDYFLSPEELLLTGQETVVDSLDLVSVDYLLTSEPQIVPFLRFSNQFLTVFVVDVHLLLILIPCLSPNTCKLSQTIPVSIARTIIQCWIQTGSLSNTKPNHQHQISVHPIYFTFSLSNINIYLYNQFL